MLQPVALTVALLSTAAGLLIFIRGLTRIISTIRLGGPTDSTRARPIGRRLWLTLTSILSHERFKKMPLVRVAHWLVMVSFPLLVATLLAGYGQLMDPGYALPLIGHWVLYEWLIETIAWLSLAGICALIVIRLRRRPTDEAPVTAAADVDDPVRHRSSRFFGSVQWQAFFVEAIIVGVTTCVIALRSLEYAWGSAAGASWASAWHFPLTAWLGELLTGASPAGLASAITLVALAKILISNAWFVVVGLQPTMGVAWHRFLALANVYARRRLDGSSALGPLHPLIVDGTAFTPESIEEMDEDATLGVGTIADFSWKALLDFSTCTECGRCQDVCPAWNTGKPLTPKGFITTLRDEAAATLPLLRAAQAKAASAPGHGEGADPHADTDVFEAAALIGDVVDPEILWSCTTCGACVDQCPVDIEHIDHVIDLRRNQVMMESAFPNEFGKVFRSMETRGNPWGRPARARMDWAKNLPFEVPQAGVDVESLAEVDYLLWVGCAGAFESRAQQTTRALAELLHTAGVRFAVLGDGESCTGDPARRAGNELLFQMLAAQNIEVLNELEATKIVVSCAHCFNTIGREYPDLGGSYEVVHHTQLLNRLVREGRLRLAPPKDGTITYHDPCYLGRHNRIYSPPRELVAQLGAHLVEMPRHGEMAMCCGAGGARVWTEEKTGSRINRVRAQEAADTGADVVATACPFCTQMLGDGSASNGTNLQVRDVATLMLESVQRAAELDAHPDPRAPLDPEAVTDPGPAPGAGTPPTPEPGTSPESPDDEASSPAP
ncbi:MAG: heterodisulfide reductase-related iron-sulfur binding cluster [Bowdeniella nasicola]|nr:heterodisulfide reductase-related iron-sulfur binding cluster [Bowdeniella nasicola]